MVGQGSTFKNSATADGGNPQSYLGSEFTLALFFPAEPRVLQLKKEQKKTPPLQ